MTVITAESINPSAFLTVRIIEDPTRDMLFPELYPPDEEALQLLALGDIAKYQFSEDEVTQEELVTAALEANIIQIKGFPAAEYSFKPRGTAIGDAAVHGAIIITDKWDVSLVFIASIEPGVEGSLSKSTVDEVWDRLKISLVLEN